MRCKYGLSASERERLAQLQEYERVQLEHLEKFKKVGGFAARLLSPHSLTPCFPSQDGEMLKQWLSAQKNTALASKDAVRAARKSE